MVKYSSLRVPKLAYLLNHHARGCTAKINSYRYREASFATAVSNASGAALLTETNLRVYDSKAELNVNPVLTDEDNQSLVYVFGSSDS